MPSTAGIVASGSAQLDQWLRANLIAFDERRSNPLANLGTLGAAGDATATGTKRLVNTGTKAVVWLPGALGNFLSVAAASGGPLDITGDIFIGAEVALTDWTPSTRQTVAARWNGSLPGSSWQFAVNANAGGDASGGLSFRWYNASNVLTTVSTGLTIVGAADGATRYVGIDLDVDNGAGGSTAQFYLSADGLAWSPFGLPVTTAGVANIASNSTGIRFGQRDTEPMAGDARRLIIKAGGISGATRLDLDPSVLTDEDAASFTATTGQTVTINRSTGTGYQTAIVLPFSAKRVFNSNPDALTVAHSAGLNPGTGSFSVWWLGRRFATTLSNGILISKWDSAGSRGWLHMNNLATADTLSIVDDGPLSQIGAVAAGSFGTLALQGFTVDRSAGVVRSFFNDAEASVALGARADFDTTADIRFGRFGTSQSQPVEERAWGIYPGALTAAQWAALRDALLVPERAAA